LSSKRTIAGVSGAVVLLICTCAPVFAGNDAADACSLLSQARVREVLGVQVGAGAHAGENRALPGSHTSTRASCAWYENGAASIGSKRVLITVLGPTGSLTPVQRFENAKAPVPRIAKTPVKGVGDDAVYVTTGMTTSMYVKKGSSVFQILVSGFRAEEAKTMEKTLAQDALAKL